MATQHESLPKRLQRYRLALTLGVALHFVSDYHVKELSDGHLRIVGDYFTQAHFSAGQWPSDQGD